MRNKVIFAVIVLILIGGAGYYIWNDLIQMSETEFPAAVNLPDTNIAIEADGDYTIQGLPLENNKIAVPNLNRSINITAGLPEESKKMVREKIEEISLKLKENPDLFSHWLQLGIYRKMIGDYKGAVEVWEYAGKIRPNNSISFNNLGDLYAYYLKDNKKAEYNFLKAIENGPKEVYIYRSVYEFYRYVMKDDAKAKAILEKGIELNPDTSQDLQYLFAQ